VAAGLEALDLREFWAKPQFMVDGSGSGSNSDAAAQEGGWMSSLEVIGGHLKALGSSATPLVGAATAET
jgi:hypothetical protein